MLKELPSFLLPCLVEVIDVLTRRTETSLLISKCGYVGTGDGESINSG